MSSTKRKLDQSTSELDTSQQEKEEVPLIVVRVKGSSSTSPEDGTSPDIRVQGEETLAVEKSSPLRTTRRGSSRKVAAFPDPAPLCPEQPSLPKEISDLEGETAEESAGSGPPSKESPASAVRMGTRKRPAPASPEQPSTSLPKDAEATVEETDSLAKEELGNETPPSQQSPAKSSRSPRGVFVPHYEPIQTRKRAKTPQDTGPVSRPGHALSGGSHRKDAVQKTPRPRLSKDEVLTPDVGPRPKAVPKSLLILEPELLPRSIKKRQERLASTVKIHTSAKVNRCPPVSWPLTSQSGVISSSVSESEVMKTSLPSPMELSSALLLAAAESESTGQEQQELRVAQEEDGTTSYILTIPSDDGSDNLAADGQIATVESMSGMEEGQVAMVTVVSESEPSGSKSDTPASLLLLAEAAYPTTAGPQTPLVTTSATQSPMRTVTSPTMTDSDGHQNKANTTSAETDISPTVVTVSTKGSSPRILTSVSPTRSAAAMTSDDQWTCTVCGELMNKRERAQHLTQHLDEEEEEEFVCDACGEQLKDEEDLELHMAVEHDEEEDETEDMDFDDNEEENNTESTQDSSTPSTPHRAVMTSAAGTPIHTCGQCGETFPFAAYLRQHVKEAHSEDGAVFTCHLCSKSFTSKTLLENHSLLHQKPGGRISFKCIRCSQCFSSAALLSSHARTCLTRVAIDCGVPKSGCGRGRGQGRGRSTSHACRVCSKTFTSEVYLKAHEQSHAKAEVDVDDTRKLQCLYCTEKFRYISPLKEHILAKHPKAFPFKCSICQRGFSRDSSRIAHEHTHQTEKLFFCSECGEGFTLQTYLNRHMKYRHLKLTRFPCNVCHKEFVRQADLVKHIRVHTGEKPYICEECGHGFGQQSNYKYHMMRHRGEKPHTCPMCSKGFRVPSHLKMHMQQHLNERFVCQLCDKVFSQSRYLHRHLRTHNTARQQARHRGTERLLPASPAASIGSGVVETVMMYDSTASQPVRTEQQIIVDSVADITEHVVVQEAASEAEPVIEFIINHRDDDGEVKRLALVDADGNAVLTTSNHSTSEEFANSVKVDSEGSAQAEVTEEQAFVNPDEGTSVVVGAFSEGEGGSVEEGNVTLPFKHLTQLLGGKHYNCDVCSESFSIRPNSTYNMIHTGQSHILVISLNDHGHPEQTDS